MDEMRTMVKGTEYKIFVDLDGVLVDFERGVLEVTGKAVDAQSAREMWGRLAKTPGFYEHLEWTPDGRVLWEYVSRFAPTILTGLPFGKWAHPQKMEWCRRELGSDVPVITCMSREKAARARNVTRPAMVPLLIDDREKGRESWEALPGVFILHTSAENSIRSLGELGIA